jgi:hypothetical protein
MISADLVGCATARNKGTCDNRMNIRRDRLEERVLNALRHHLMDPALFKEFCDKFTREMNRLRMEGRASIDVAKSKLGRIEKQIKSTVDAIADGMYHPSMKEKMDGLETRKKEIEAFLADAEEPPPLLHPEMDNVYRTRVSELYDALQEETEAKRLTAGEVLRSLVKEIILTPENGELKIDVRGDLAGILSISLKSKTPATGTGGSQVEMVAGTQTELADLLGKDAQSVARWERMKTVIPPTEDRALRQIYLEETGHTVKFVDTVRRVAEIRKRVERVTFRALPQGVWESQAA